MPKRNRIIEISIPDGSDLIFNASCPFVEDEMSDWEKQEVGRLWSNALRYYREAAESIATNVRALVTADIQIPGGSGWGGSRTLGYAADAERCQLELTTVLQGYKHRQALAARAAERG